LIGFRETGHEYHASEYLHILVLLKLCNWQ